ncbi:hypothetical protein CRG98_049152, partial [Punica granatum]
SLNSADRLEGALGRRVGPGVRMPGRITEDWAVRVGIGPRARRLGRGERWAAEDFGPQMDWAERAGP